MVVITTYSSIDEVSEKQRTGDYYFLDKDTGD